MTQSVDAGVLERRVRDLLELRTDVNARFFDEHSERIALLCHRMAERFSRGGRLIALGHSPADRSDVRHVAVEFVHPVIVGKRALPAFGVSGDAGSLAAQIDLLTAADDILIAFGAGSRVAEAIGAARGRDCLTIAFADAGAEWEFVPSVAEPFVAQELVETLYHVLWELVHVFFEHRGLLEGRAAGAVHDAGAASFLYPFLGQNERGLDAVLADVRSSVIMKAEEVSELRRQTLGDNAAALVAAASALRAVLDGGGKVLALGNGGSATDAMDAVADFRQPPSPWPPRAALDLSEDPAIITAIANDIGTEAIFARQVIAYGTKRDALLAISTSGNSLNVIAALAEARARRLETIALVGYDGGRVTAEGLADHVIVTRSQHIPRIQEAQASAYHVLRELVELV